MPILNTMPTGKGKLPVASTHSAKQNSQGIAYTDDAKPRRRGADPNLGPNNRVF